MSVRLEDPETARHEIKLVADETDYHSVALAVRLHPAAFREAYPSRWINSVYFDSLGLDACMDNLAGISRRTKVRFRWYGDLHGFESGTLEFKRKRNQFGWKDRFEVAGRIDLRASSWRQLRSHIRSGLPSSALELYDRNMLPVLINRYCRDYYISADGKVRITLDRGLRIFDQRTRPAPNLSFESPLAHTMVVETKFAVEDRGRAQEVLQSLPIRVSKNSKYVRGVLSITGV